jgi:signal transduction histidine kinase
MRFVMKNNNIQSATRRFSLQHRLPLWICLLLLGTVIACSLISYIGVRNAALQIGSERLMALSGQLSSMFSQSSQNVLTATRTAANSEQVVQFLRGDTAMKKQAKTALDKLRPDSTWALVVLLDEGWQPVLRSRNDTARPRAGFDRLLEQLPTADSASMGKFYRVEQSIYYPVIVPVTYKQKIIGHLLRWKLQTATPKSLEQLSQLMGTKAKLYFGNADGSVWTDLLRQVSFQVPDSTQSRRPFQYKDAEGKAVLAATAPIAHTPWILAISFSRQVVLDAANRFLRWIILVGLILIIIGIYVGWQISRNIILPLNRLTAAAQAIASGERTEPVTVDRNDELGTLAAAFNSMGVQVHQAKQDLEKKVKDRTIQLESANRELESFSYSISHDLRAPLRAIIGFTTILREDHTAHLSDEAKRITAIIKQNTEKMGHLIDDLLAFAKVGRVDIRKTHIDTHEMVHSVINELLPADTGNYIDLVVSALPPISGDRSVIRQVWINLLSNAIKYSKNQSRPRIEIGSYDLDAQTVFYIKDNGVGFDERYKDKLFKVFQRLHSAQEFEGTGIGLALVEKIISKHSGKVWAESVVDKGSSFYFSLPKEDTSAIRINIQTMNG